MNDDSGAQPYLMLRDPDGQMTRVSLDDLPLTIGRRSTNAIQVLDPTVSRDHARIDRDGEQYFVHDLGSTHGTFVNQERIDRHDLSANDRIRLGGAMGHVITFRSGGEFTMLIGTTGKQNPTAPVTETTPAGGVARQESAQSLTALLEISKALNSSLRITDVLEKVMDAVIALTDGERCLMLLGESADELEVAAHRNLEGGTDEVVYSQSVVRNVFDSEESTILTDVAEDDRFSAQQSIVGLHLKTVMCVPLRLSHFSEDAEPRLGEYQTGSAENSTSRILGVLYLDRKSATRHFGDQDLSVLESFASHAAIAIDNARLYEEALEKRRMEEDLRVANRIQRSLLLSDFPESDWYDVHAINIPSRGVGGDYYEFFDVPGGGLGFAVGDVSGKGIPAAMLMATLQAAFLAAIRLDSNIADVCAHINNFIVERTSPERYATFFVGQLHTDGKLDYVNAGHNPALLVHPDGETHELFGGGMPIGLFPDREYEIQTVQVPAGSVIATYSDGVTEANNPKEEEYEMERFGKALRAHSKEGAHGIIKEVFDDVEKFAEGVPPFDDLTLMIVKRLGE
ncbi:MAG: SpoIIE family protein phosphatase [Acidobacteria bacterium]|nr:SpoIIE family protein phosphatase [Acidobacteriota bacterium]